MIMSPVNFVRGFKYGVHPPSVWSSRYLWVGPVVGIQVTEWVSVKNKISDGERMGCGPGLVSEARIY